MAEVSLEHISKTYAGEGGRRAAQKTARQTGANPAGTNSAKAIDDISFTVRDKEFMVMVGPSGCGKSTLLRMIAGLEEIGEGTIRIDGKPINHLGPADRDIAMVFQNYALYPHMTVYENMAFGLKLRNFSRSEIRTRVMQTAALLEIEGELDRKPKALSGGQRQRVAIGRAIIRRPKVFLFDEPLSNLDAKLRGQMRVELQKLHREIDATMIYVTHDQTEAMVLGHRIAVLNKGRLIQLDEPLNVYHRPANRFVAGFIGSPAMNFLPGMLEEGAVGARSAGSGSAGSGAGYSFVDERGLWRVSLGADIPETLKGYTGKPVVMGLRPEHIRICDNDDLRRDGAGNDAGWSGAEADAGVECPGRPTIHGRVVANENMGNEQLVYLSLAQQELVIRRPPTGQMEAGTERALQFMTGEIVWLDGVSGETIR
jgi:multiple sugar transport system ATP-binding protein